MFTQKKPSRILITEDPNYLTNIFVVIKIQLVKTISESKL